MSIEYYLPNRQRYEIGFWVVIFSLAFISESIVAYIDAQRNNADIALWEILCWEASSTAVMLSLIRVVVLFDCKFPLGWSNPRINIMAHVGFSFVFSVLHVVLMVSIRKAVYWVLGSNYNFGHPLSQFIYEYMKDFRSYAIIIALLYLYRHILFRLQGEASLLGEPDEGVTEETSTYPERMLVKKLGREFLVQVKSIERVEAAGNYVNLHIGERIYPLRETMKNIVSRLDQETFKRIHRSHIVNLNFVKEILPLDTGDAQVVLSSGKQVAMSRTYRAELKGQFE